MSTVSDTTAIEQVEDQDLFEDAAAFLEEEVVQLQTIGHQDFHVTDQASADWVVNKIQSWEREREQRKAAYIEADNKLKRKIEWFKGRFTLELEDYTLSVLNAQRGKKAKSIKLPCGGVLAFRKQATKLLVKDEAAYQAWVLQHLPTAITEFVPSIDKKAVNEHAFTLGDVPDGTEIIPEHDEFKITV